MTTSAITNAKGFKAVFSHGMLFQSMSLIQQCYIISFFYVYKLYSV